MKTSKTATMKSPSYHPNFRRIAAFKATSWCPTSPVEPFWTPPHGPAALKRPASPVRPRAGHCQGRAKCGWNQDFNGVYPLVNYITTMENQYKWPVSIAMLVYQRVYSYETTGDEIGFTYGTL